MSDENSGINARTETIRPSGSRLSIVTVRDDTLRQPPSSSPRSLGTSSTDHTKTDATTIPGAVHRAGRQVVRDPIAAANVAGSLSVCLVHSPSPFGAAPS